MKTTLRIKLAPTPAQHQSLLRTMKQFNAACDFIAKVAFQQQLASKFKLQKIVYQYMRNMRPLLT
jgi:putative transposase